MTHGNISHLLSNMVCLMIWGTQLENYYGTFFYAFLNLVISILSNFITISIQFFRAYYMPEMIYEYQVGGL
jgi:membrane associated rhomboid family serine protease